MIRNIVNRTLCGDSHHIGSRVLWSQKTPTKESQRSPKWTTGCDAS